MNRRRSSPVLSQVNWPELHARLRAAAEQSASTGDLSGELEDAKLAERAHRFAQLPVAPAVAADRVDFLEFELGPERFAVEVHCVANVQAFDQLTPIPCAPAHIRGIVPVQGELIAVLDLGAWLQLPRHGLTQLDQLIVLQANALKLAVLADSIVGVRQVQLAALQTGAGDGTVLRILEAGALGGGRLGLLDVERLLLNPSLLNRRQSASWQN